jgi:hypothetical protein
MKYTCRGCGQNLGQASSHQCPGPFTGHAQGIQGAQGGGLSSIAAVAPKGWECPRCRSVYAPFVSECSRCNAKLPEAKAQG